jgi:hypothetical protein
MGRDWGKFSTKWSVGSWDTSCLKVGRDSRLQGEGTQRLTEEVQLLGKGTYILENPHPPGGEKIANVIWGKKYEKAKRKRVKM